MTHTTAEPLERAYLVAAEIKGRRNSRPDRPYGWNSQSSLEEGLRRLEGWRP